jgi:hypothetical protein
MWPNGFWKDGKRRPFAIRVMQDDGLAHTWRVRSHGTVRRRAEYTRANEAVGASAFSESEGFVQICPEGVSALLLDCHFLPVVPRPPTRTTQCRLGANRDRMARTSAGKHRRLAPRRERTRGFAAACGGGPRCDKAMRTDPRAVRQSDAPDFRPGRKHPQWRDCDRGESLLAAGAAS